MASKLTFIFKIKCKTSMKRYSCGSWFGIHFQILWGRRLLFYYINVIIMYYITLGVLGRKGEISYSGESSLHKFGTLGSVKGPNKVGNMTTRELWNYNCATRMILTFADPFLKN